MLLYQIQDGYCYNSDTHFLYDFVLKCLEKYKNIKGELLDIGSGCGILGLLLARDFEKLKLNQVELQEQFCFLSQKNASINKINSKLYKGDFLKLSFESCFDIIVSNPPFYHENVQKSVKNLFRIARYNDFLPLKEFMKKISKISNANTKIFFCYDAKQLKNIIIFANEFSLNIEGLRFVYPTENKSSNLVLVFLKKNSKALLNIFQPLIVSKEDNFTHEVEEIYKKCDTYSIKSKV